MNERPSAVESAFLCRGFRRMIDRSQSES